MEWGNELGTILMHLKSSSLLVFGWTNQAWTNCDPDADRARMTSKLRPIFQDFWSNR